VTKRLTLHCFNFFASVKRFIALIFAAINGLLRHCFPSLPQLPLRLKENLRKELMKQ
jgi:hypothetical protein